MVLQSDHIRNLLDSPRERQEFESVLGSIGALDSAILETTEQARLRIPLRPGNRSLNLSNAAAVALYEAWRQIGFGEDGAKLGALRGAERVEHRHRLRCRERGVVAGHRLEVVRRIGGVADVGDGLLDGVADLAGDGEGECGSPAFGPGSDDDGQRRRAVAATFGPKTSERISVTEPVDGRGRSTQADKR